MNKDRNVVSLTEVCDIDESPSSSKNLDVLNEIDTEFMRFSKALLSEDINYWKRMKSVQRNPQSHSAQKFWSQSENYRMVLAYAVEASINGRAKALKSIELETNAVMQTLLRIVKDAESAGYLEVFNKGNNSVYYPTSIKATNWQTLHYLQFYIFDKAIYRAEMITGYNLNQFFDEYLPKIMVSNKEIDRFNTRLKNLKDNIKKKV